VARGRSLGCVGWWADADARPGEVIDVTVFAVLATLAVAWVVALESLFAAAWLSPVGWALAMSPAILLVLFTLTPVYAKQSKVRWIAFGAFLLGVLVVLVPWNARKRFVHDVFSVRAGISVDEVEAIMGGYIKGAGAAWHLPHAPDPRVRPPDEPEDAAEGELARATFESYRAPDYPTGVDRDYYTGTMIYRWSTRPEYNADWGAIEFVAGKVVKVDFLPD